MAMRYKYFPERGLLVDVLSDEISLADVKALFRELQQSKHFKSVDRVISDISKAQFRIKISDVDEFIRVLNETDRVVDFRWAILSTKPLPTAFSYLVSLAPAFRNKLGIFSTIEGCIKYLNIRFDPEELNTDGYTDYHGLG